MKKTYIILLLLWFSNILKAQYYDPSTMMMNQMFNDMNEQLNKQMAQTFDNLLELQEQQKAQFDKSSSAHILYLPSNDYFCAFVTYSGGSPAKIVYISPMNTRKTLILNKDYFYAQGSILVTTKLKEGSSLRVYNNGTGKLLDNKSIPKRGSKGYRIFCKTVKDNCSRVATILYGKALANMNNDNYSSSTYSPSSREKKQCSFCGGRGWYPACSSPTYGNMETQYCSICQRSVAASHSHDKCPSCGGTGYSY